MISLLAQFSSDAGQTPRPRELPATQMTLPLLLPLLLLTCRCPGADSLGQTFCVLLRICCHVAWTGTGGRGWLTLKTLRRKKLRRRRSRRWWNWTRGTGEGAPEVGEPSSFSIERILQQTKNSTFSLLFLLFHNILILLLFFSTIFLLTHLPYFHFFLILSPPRPSSLSSALILFTIYSSSSSTILTHPLDSSSLSSISSSSFSSFAILILPPCPLPRYPHPKFLNLDQNSRRVEREIRQIKELATTQVLSISTKHLNLNTNDGKF